jgi:hypothetical protein
MPDTSGETYGTTGSPTDKPFNQKDIPRILELAKSDDASNDIARQLQLSHRAIMLVLSSYT